MFGLLNSAHTIDAATIAALDKLPTKIMAADLGNKIIYANPPCMAFLASAEKELQKTMPYFSANKVIGDNIGVFYSDADRRKQMLDNLHHPYKDTLGIGGHQHDMIAIPLTDKNGKRSGTIVEWTDATDRLLNIDYASRLEAINKSQAVIEFNMDGTIITANENFLSAMGYRLDEIVGKKHSIFIEASHREDLEYLRFWATLNEGKYQSAEYKRVGKNGKEVWIQASYNPILDHNGKPYKVVKFATDVTAQKMRNADYAGQIDAISKSQAVIEFNLDGTIITANPNFLNVMGYNLAEVQGRHHSMFAPADYGNSTEYKQFWAALNRGEYQAGEYMRLARGGREVWIQASYNPILDSNGRPFKVVKFAADVTKQVMARKKSEHINSILNGTAAGAEQLSASVKQIAEAMIKSRNTANMAYDKVLEADQTTARLSAVAQSMGGIVALIGGITSQINLLALNATIEAARAGEAGRGFAVVANEVKNLASQAKKATDQIIEEISGMRAVSDDVITALGSIRSSLDEVRDYVVSTAAAVEEQSTVANEMSANMQQAAAEASSLGQ